MAQSQSEREPLIPVGSAFILYCIILHYIILYYIISHYTILYYYVLLLLLLLYCTILHYLPIYASWHSLIFCILLFETNDIINIFILNWTTLHFQIFICIFSNFVFFVNSCLTCHILPQANCWLRSPVQLQQKMTTSLWCMSCRYPPAEGSMKLVAPAVSIIAPPIAPPPAFPPFADQDFDCSRQSKTHRLPALPSLASRDQKKKSDWNDFHSSPGDTEHWGDGAPPRTLEASPTQCHRSRSCSYIWASRPRVFINWHLVQVQQRLQSMRLIKAPPPSTSNHPTAQTHLPLRLKSGDWCAVLLFLSFVIEISQAAFFPANVACRVSAVVTQQGSQLRAMMHEAASVRTPPTLFRSLFPSLPLHFKLFCGGSSHCRAGLARAKSRMQHACMEASQR